MLYFIGLGMTPDAISLRALRIVKQCKKIYLDAYTSILRSYEEMAALMSEILERPDLIPADRGLVENSSDEIVENALSEDVAFLVVGDPMCATTHADLFLRARARGVRAEVLGNCSIVNAVAASGLSIYDFGREFCAVL